MRDKIIMSVSQKVDSSGIRKDRPSVEQITLSLVRVTLGRGIKTRGIVVQKNLEPVFDSRCDSRWC